MAPNPKKKKEKVFNDRGRKIFRKRISTAETVFGAGFIAFTALMGAWFALQRDNYDPGERDISIKVLEAQSVEDKLYRTPLLRWTDPSVVHAGGVATPDFGFFPAAAFAPGWAPSAPPQTFDGTNLYEKIDGQEVQYKAYGFQMLYFLAIADSGGEQEINIELYDMGEFQNALGIFGAQRGADRNVEANGDVISYMTDAGGIGMVDKYYFKLTGNGSGEPILAQSRHFIQNFPANVARSGGGTPYPFTLLASKLGYAFQDIEYVKEDAFSYSFCKDFWFGRSTTVEDMRVFIHQHDSPESASGLFQQILDEQLNEFEEVSRDGNAVVLKHEFLNTYFGLARSGPFLFGVEGAPGEAVLDGVMKPVREMLDAEAAPAAEAKPEA